MKVSLNWLRELIDINLEYHELEQCFNLKSAEVAGLYPLTQATNLTVGLVLSCEKHPNADTLSVCLVDVGEQKLQIVCGAPNVRKDQKVIVALVGSILVGGLKIKNAKIRGIESNGMICSLDELGIDHKYHQEDGIHVLPDDAPIGANPLEILHFDDYVLELDLTPNRADLLSVIGVGYDVAAMTGRKLRLPETDFETVDDKNPISVITETPGCMSYYGQTIRNIKVAKSPYWLQARLIASGIRPINNVVDITNYVMLEYGNPLHAFDYDKLSSSRIIVRDARKNETIVTLDGKSRVLNVDDMVITNGDQAIAIAGVMGGESTEVSQDTTSLFLEAATFDPIRVRKTSRKLGLRSESSLRFERGLDPKQTLKAAKRAMWLLQELCGGEVLSGVSYFDTNNLQDLKITISLEKIAKTIGISISPQDIDEIWSRLGFPYSFHGQEYTVTVPSRRQDIRTYQDLIEEIVRLYGYDKIPMTYPKTPTNGYLSKKQHDIRKLRNIMVSQGFDETITYSLVAPDKAVMFDLIDEKPISLLNPLSEERACLRHSLLPSLISVARYNLARNIEDLSLFEIGKSYRFDNEDTLWSGIALGRHRPSHWQKIVDKTDFFLVKGVVEAAILALGYHDVVFIRKQEFKNLHPGISASIVVNGKEIGHLGRLHPEIEHQEELPETYVFEINLSQLLSFERNPISMHPLSRFPAVSRDLAFVVDDQVEASALIDTIKSANIASLRQVVVFDVYCGDNLPKGQKSLAVNLIFQLDDRTLALEEVDGFVAKILKKADAVGARLR